MYVVTIMSLFWSPVTISCFCFKYNDRKCRQQNTEHASNTMSVSVINKIRRRIVSQIPYDHRENIYGDRNEHILKSTDRIVLSLEIQWLSRVNVSWACILLEGREIVCVRTWKWCRKRSVRWGQGQICPSFLFPVTNILGENINIHNAEQIFLDAPCN